MTVRFLGSRPGRVACVVALLVALGGQPTPASAWLPKLDTALQSILANPLSGVSRARTIVTAGPGQLGALVLWLRLGGFTILGEHAAIDAVTIEAPRAALLTIAALNVVRSLSLDAPARALGVPAGTGERLRATLGVSGFTGAGVGVGVIDSGIHPEAEFTGRITSFYDFTASGKPVARSPFDDYGHGTHVAGLIGASANPSSGIYGGVAPDVRLVGLKVLDGTGAGYTSHVISAIEFATKNRASLGIDVLNLSLGHPIYERAVTDPLVRMVDYAVRKGVVVVVSAGNYGTSAATGQVANGGITSPGNTPAAITVGALNTFDTVNRVDDEVASYSSRGPTWYDGFSKPDLVAPGHALSAPVGAQSRLWSRYPSLRAAAAGPTGHMRLSGTSMAAAVTTGVVALALEAHRARGASQPAMTPNTVKALLQFTALPLAAMGVPLSAAERLAYGAGGLNADGATALASRIDTSVRVGDWWLASPVEPLSAMGGIALPWVQYIIWGSHLVWGDSVYSHRHAFTSAVTWDTHVVWGDHIVWGDHTVWGLDRTWGSHIVWGDTWIGRSNGSHIVWGDSQFTQGTVAWGDLSKSSAQPANTFTGASP